MLEESAARRSDVVVEEDDSDDEVFVARRSEAAADIELTEPPPRAGAGADDRSLSNEDADAELITGPNSSSGGGDAAASSPPPRAHALARLARALRLPSLSPGFRPLDDRGTPLAARKAGDGFAVASPSPDARAAARAARRREKEERAALALSLDIAAWRWRDTVAYWVSVFFLIGSFLFTLGGAFWLDLLVREGRAADDDGRGAPTPYTVFTTSPLSWQAARSACQALGGDLATISNVEDDAAVLAAVQAEYNAGNWPSSNGYGGAWIGASDATQEGTWVWTVDRNGSTYMNWGPGEPNNSGEEDCVTIWEPGSRAGSWNDDDCTAAHPYVCELTPAADDQRRRATGAAALATAPRGPEALQRR